MTRQVTDEILENIDGRGAKVPVDPKTLMFLSSGAMLPVAGIVPAAGGLLGGLGGLWAHKRFLGGLLKHPTIPGLLGVGAGALLARDLYEHKL